MSCPRRGVSSAETNRWRAASDQGARGSGDGESFDVGGVPTGRDDQGQRSLCSAGERDGGCPALGLPEPALRGLLPHSQLDRGLTQGLGQLGDLGL
jgi:hypothetical protein